MYSTYIHATRNSLSLIHCDNPNQYEAAASLTQINTIEFILLCLANIISANTVQTSDELKATEEIPHYGAECSLPSKITPEMVGSYNT